MPRKLKTYQTSQGFYDMAIAAPSMKAALQAWGMNSNLFHQGFAWESDDPRIIEATMQAPGVTLRRPVGSKGKFVEHPHLPKELPAHGQVERRMPAKKNARKEPAGSSKPAKKIDPKAAKKAAAAFEKRQRRLEERQRREGALREKQKARRERAANKVQAKLDEAEREHGHKIAAIEKERAALEQRAQAEGSRWNKERDRLESARRRASSGNGTNT